MAQDQGNTQRAVTRQERIERINMEINKFSDDELSRFESRLSEIRSNLNQPSTVGSSNR